VYAAAICLQGAVGVADGTCPNPDPYTIVDDVKEYTPYGLGLVQATSAGVVTASADVAHNVSTP
jgi:hypothetical protein